MVEFFFDTVNSTRSFATGGSTHVEIWLDPHEHGATMREGLEEGWAGAHQESCTSYNIFKVPSPTHQTPATVLLASPSELLASPSELSASPSELSASPGELSASPSELSASPSEL
jgi:hypothetical protein